MTNAEARFNKSHIRKVYACLAVTCHLHFRQNDRDFLRATVVTRGWNGYRNKSQHRKSTLEKKILPPFQQGSFNHKSGALTTELSPPPYKQLRNKSKYKDNFYEVFSLSFCEVKCLIATIRRKLDTKLLVQNTPEHYSPNTRYYSDKTLKTHPVTGKTTVIEGAEKTV